MSVVQSPSALSVCVPPSRLCLRLHVASSLCPCLRCVSGRAGETLFGDARASGLCVSGRAGGTLFRDALASGRLSLAGQGGRCLEMHWACLGSHLGRLSRHSGHDPEGKQTHVGGSEGIQPSGALLRAAPPPREEAGHQFPARVGPAPSPSFGDGQGWETLANPPFLTSVLSSPPGTFPPASSGLRTLPSPLPSSHKAGVTPDSRAKHIKAEST